MQKGAPNTEVLVIGHFWDKSEKGVMKKAAGGACGVTFVSLDKIKNSKRYQCGLGTTVYDEKDNPRTVEHNGVAKHPNDGKMKWIVEKIVEEI